MSFRVDLGAPDLTGPLQWLFPEKLIKFSVSETADSMSASSRPRPTYTLQNAERLGSERTREGLTPSDTFLMFSAAYFTSEIVLHDFEMREWGREM